MVPTYMYLCTLYHSIAAAQSWTFFRSSSSEIDVGKLIKNKRREKILSAIKPQAVHVNV